MPRSRREGYDVIPHDKNGSLYLELTGKEEGLCGQYRNARRQSQYNAPEKLCSCPWGGTGTY